MEPTLLEHSQSQLERLRFIDFRLYFLATLNRNDLTSRFGIKEAAATRDISLYRELRPNNARYDSNAKTYFREASFTPLFSYESNQVLTALSRGIGDDVIGVRKPLIYCDTPAQFCSSPAIDVLANLANAISLSKAVSIEYHSVNSGKSKREIVPFVFVDNGLRWHIRGFDRKRKRFSDFVLTRITKAEIVEGMPEAHERREQDNQWNRIVELELVPHPNIEHSKAVELDYQMQNGALNMPVRAAVAGYVLRRWNVDCTTDHSLKGGEYQLWLKNTLALYGVDNLSIAPGYNHP